VGNTSFCPSDSSEGEDCFATFAKSPFWQFGNIGGIEYFFVHHLLSLKVESSWGVAPNPTFFFALVQKRMYN
jgi:hypothetical protein